MQHVDYTFVAVSPVHGPSFKMFGALYYVQLSAAQACGAAYGFSFSATAVAVVQPQVRNCALCALRGPTLSLSICHTAVDS